MDPLQQSDHSENQCAELAHPLLEMVPGFGWVIKDEPAMEVFKLKRGGKAGITDAITNFGVPKVPAEARPPTGTFEDLPNAALEPVKSRRIYTFIDDQGTERPTYVDLATTYADGTPLMIAKHGTTKGGTLFERMTSNSAFAKSHIPWVASPSTSSQADHASEDSNLKYNSSNGYCDPIRVVVQPGFKNTLQYHLLQPFLKEVLDPARLRKYISDISVEDVEKIRRFRMTTAMLLEMLQHWILTFAISLSSGSPPRC